MKFNFYISCETADEAQKCIAFIDKMISGRKTWEDQVDEKPNLRTNPTPKPVVKDEEPAESDDSKQAGNERKNVNPGEPAIGKMGTATEDEIIHDLEKQDRVPTSYANGKREEHLKLLWKRGKVKFDGREYYL